MEIAYDRGTLRIAGAAPPDLPWTVWDERVSAWRAPAYRYAGLLDACRARGIAATDTVAPGIRRVGGRWKHIDLRPYQEDAVRAFGAFGERGVVVMPTGSGKTRVALRAMAAADTSCLVLCPTRALLGQWERAIAAAYDGPVGVVGDGARSIDDITVMTFESAYRHLDDLGALFGMIVVDEAHHFAGGLRAEALEMAVAPRRLGLTATPPALGSQGETRLADLLGHVAFEVPLKALLGEHLADLELTRIFVTLSRDEAATYATLYTPYAEARRALARQYPELSWIDLQRALARSPEGRRVLQGYRRAAALASLPAAKRGWVRELLLRHKRDRTLVFTASADDAYAIGRSDLVPVITAETSRAEREEIFLRFRAGVYRAIVSARVLNEGVDVPDANVAILVAGTLGAREHVQRIGRVLRPAPGKRAVVYELITRDTIDDGRARARAASHAAA